MASFPQFSRLPAEIQWMIWELALSGPNAHFLTMNSGHHPLSQVRRIVNRYTDRQPVTDLHRFGESLSLVRLYKKDIRCGVNSLFPLFDAAEDMLVISPIHAGIFDRPRVSYPSIPLSFETVGSVGKWQQQFPLVVNDLPATGSLASATSVAIYWKSEMDDGAVCRQINWLWTGDACPNLQTIYLVDMDCPLFHHEFEAMKKNNRIMAGPWACPGGRLLAEVKRPIKVGDSVLANTSNIGACVEGNEARDLLYQLFHSTVRNFVSLSAQGMAREGRAVRPIQVRNLTVFGPA
ncbi:hypothetical protein QBC40DRAFT_297463 [Triangularia verruculosa]|uniref:2EXR domain-containing protein n=1 Tax=Triangularia verruculosa TaxID=2587418 RepID=A0AAN7AUV7_9PEZI|nr:hypothetical protein QBC40DRAFT_297463 [Triangularia verruculosa]